MCHKIKVLLIVVFVFVSYISKAQFMGYYPSGSIDTVKMPMLVTANKSEGCPAKIMWVLCVRERMDYKGDRMPPGDYSSWYKTIKYLNTNKQPFNNSIVIWSTQPANLMLNK